MSKTYRRFWTLISLTILALATMLPSQLNAQAISGDVVGTVLDKTGAAVPSATVEAVSTTTGVKYSSKASETGEYRFTNLPVGIYNLSASAASFGTTTIHDFKVDLNRTVTQNITLEIKGAVTSIEVSGEAPSLDLATPTISTTFEQKQLDLPSVGSNGGSGVLNLSLLTAGVANAGALGAGSGPAIGGQRPRNNNFTVEGIDNNSKGVTGPLVPVPSDSIAEFTLLQNDYAPEFGHSNGGQFNYVLKSGENTFHGQGYEYFQNRNLNAIDAVVVRNTAPGDTPKNPRFTLPSVPFRDLHRLTRGETWRSSQSTRRQHLRAATAPARPPRILLGTTTQTQLSLPHRRARNTVVFSSRTRRPRWDSQVLTRGSCRWLPPTTSIT